MAITANDFKKLSPQLKAIIIVAAVIIIGYLYYMNFASALLDDKAKFTKEIVEKNKQIEEKRKIAGQLQEYINAVAALQDNYKMALTKLPDQREIPELLLAVAQAGREAGVEFALFEPKAAIPKTMAVTEVAKTEKPAPAAGKKGPPPPAPEPFYEELPNAVSVIGNYQNILSFFEKVAKLSRIVNVSEITVGDRKEVKGHGFALTTNCTIKTYMFVDKKEKVSEKTK